MGRERHGIKDTARTCVFVGTALFIRNRILGCVDKILRGTNDTNYREKTDGNHKNSFAIPTVGKNTVDVRGNTLGKVVCAAAATAATVGLHLGNASTENDGVHNLHHRGRNVLLPTAGLGNRTKIVGIGVALEYANVAFSTVKHHVLFHNGNTVKLLRSACAHASLERKLDIETNGHGIKAAVKTNGVNSHKRPCDARILDTNGRGMFYDLISDVGQENTNILKAISVTARVQDPVGLNTDHIPIATAP